jgi:Cu-Zn family superoxide dismutase
MSLAKRRVRSLSGAGVLLSGAMIWGCNEQPVVAEHDAGAGPATTTGRDAGRPATTATAPPAATLTSRPDLVDAGPSDAAVGTVTMAEVGKAIDVTLEPKSGSNVAGSVRFVQEKEGVKVTATFTRAPAGKHGLHIHEKADCSDPKAENAGDHFKIGRQLHGNPSGSSHDGADPDAKTHIGDLGNIDIDKGGGGKLEHTILKATLAPGQPTSLVGHAILLHEHEDDGKDPSGHAGGRIACGVIK